jgi:hypothetical protein
MTNAFQKIAARNQKSLRDLTVFLLALSGTALGVSGIIAGW